ncbi:MAG: hypothetical protein HY744_30895 [Deltaproteobacteria bacterium]|nr:hypothetical protein [Deltaproteobacteria bacterium]
MGTLRPWRCGRPFVAAVILLLPLLLAAWPGTTHAAGASRIAWTSVEVRAGEDGARVSRTLRGLLLGATRRADWGRGGPLRLRAKVTELSWEVREDLVRVRCVVVAGIEGGPRVRSLIQVGGRPSERAELERQALGIVAGGVVTRLADIARARARSQ